ncbi:MAG: Phosphoserine phosphatase / D-3-phosphoglycerate dehydrogenase [Cytophagales bacterium]|jgi:D-3-phosphoglycerate dehydrogenase|nr:phosphoglycerate dehydrogenase [Bacteroidota bacterium]MBS1979561.1 phosphoglycerate dehydrogenase [Bacteroidota bacterium]WHZ09238.1 MAG: Phosphoserine phosphatase / D-3-phosphoglycerate dehydrogenase [Cytophagales bacterium]
MKPNKYFVIDFDSTFTKVEAFDVLADISLEGHPEKNQIKKKILDITNQGMEGVLSLRESIQKRIELLSPQKKHIHLLVNHLKSLVSESFKRNKDFFISHAENIYIISNGFKEFVEPVVTEFGIKKENVLANEFVTDGNGKITGVNTNNPLSANNGKVEMLKQLNLPGDVYVIGDGYTDYEIKHSGLANKFYAFTENIERESVLAKADHIAPSLDEFLYLNKLNTVISYPKNRISVLLLENVHPIALELMKAEGFAVETYPAGLDESELSEKIKNVSVLGIRSKTQVTAKVLENANRLMAIGAFCIGTNQIDLKAATQKGVAVFNAPFSNTRSVVEMAIAEMIMLIRGFYDKSNKMHLGKWDKSAKGSYEVRGKKLGIIGYGNIGAQLSVIAENLGMKVFYYDKEEKLALGNAVKCKSQKELLNLADVVTLHVDGRESNTNIIGGEEFAQMKKGVIFLNLSRGHVVDVKALRENILNGKVAGCAVDVFPYEPISNDEEFVSDLCGLPNVILTPHIGGSTAEAQENIGNFVPGKLMDYINTGSTSNSVNFPNLTLPTLENAHRLIHIHHNVPGILARINQTLADHGINIVGQYLKTNEQIGYVITDINKEYDKEVIKQLRAIEHTIKFRVLY